MSYLILTSGQDLSLHFPVHLVLAIHVVDVLLISSKLLRSPFHILFGSFLLLFLPQPVRLLCCLMYGFRLQLTCGALLVLCPDIPDSLPLFKVRLKCWNSSFTIRPSGLGSSSSCRISLIHDKHEVLLLRCDCLVGR